MFLRLIRFQILIVASVLFSAPLFAQTWHPMGPEGGDVRVLAADPTHPEILYMGTTDGHIFGSRDGGEHWQILGRAGVRLDGVITSIVVDPRNSQEIFASSWTRETGGEGGGIFSSHDGGLTWTSAGLLGHAVRALAQSPSNPEILVAGALDGVFRSVNDGATWRQISPADDPELHNVDSLAIDPRHPDTIYAGTFHLPWKTIDGGKHWTPIHAGMIDDSDVLSLAVDAVHPHRVFASACSGIYRSENGGAVWQKIQGVPFSARRTYVIRQDAQHPNIVYAGTTEGLWQSRDGGAEWKRITSHDWVINTLAIVPEEGSRSGRIVLGTEQLGVLVSDDGGQRFQVQNDGFFHREIIALALDRDHPGRVLAVLANAPEPVLATEDGGRTWTPLGPGLRTEGLKSVYAAPTGWWATLDRGGLMRYDAQKSAWVRAGALSGEAAAYTDRHGKVIQPSGSVPFSLVVNDMAFSRDVWFAATDHGLLASRDSGESWTIYHFAPIDLPVNSVRASPDGQDIRVVSLRGMVFSLDGGQTWSWHDLPFEAGGALRLDRAADGTLLASAQKGLYVSRDAGATWQKVASGLPEAGVRDLALTEKVWLASMETGGLYLSRDEARSWTRVSGTLAEGFFPVVTTAESGGAIYAASATEGLYSVEINDHPSDPAPTLSSAPASVPVTPSAVPPSSAPAPAPASATSTAADPPSHR